jgi:glucose/arabinose dehydrogenase
VYRKPCTLATILISAAATLVVASGSAVSEPASIQAVPPTPRIANTIATGLAVPWGLAFLPDGSALVSERNTARIKRIASNGTVTIIGTVPNVRPGGEGGLLGIAVASTFNSDRFVYAYFTGASDNRVVRMTFNGTSLGTQQVLITGIPRASIHNGGRLAFGPDGMLYVSTGDAGNTANAQNRNSLGGKILRVTPTGAAAPGNPVAGSRVYSLGHRNVQGLAFEGSRLWAGEFGQNTLDELNLIRADGNYGWPTCEGRCNDTRFVSPIAQWSTAQASPSGVAFARNTVWLAALRGTRLWAVPVLNGGPDGTPVSFFNGTHGRYRTVATAPDGSLWLITNNTDGRGTPRAGDDRIVRLVF